MICFIKAEAYDKSIDLVVSLKNEEMSEFLIQIFAGNASIFEDDNLNRKVVEPIYLFRLYLELEKFEDANQVALIIVEKEAENGHYGKAKEKISQMIS